MALTVYNIEQFEKILISKKNRFQLSSSQKKEIFQKIYKKNHIIIGAAGSICSVFSKYLLSFKPNKVFLIDKDENELTELNRELNVYKNNNCEVNYICCDILNLNLKNFSLINNITGIYNFSALKHVRSEENLISSNYMFKVNSANFLNFNYPKNVKYIFSVSTDKANKPTSLLGVSKKLMEHTLFEIKKKNKKKNICSVRFTNVSFSKGSILKSIYDRCIKGGTFGIPLNVKRYFITHEESASLCFKSLLNECRNNIVLPNPDQINHPKDIYELCLKILKKLNVKFKMNKESLNAKNIKIRFNKILTYGQKRIEDLSVNEEKYITLNDKIIIKTKFRRLNNYQKIIKKLKKNSLADTKKIAKSIYPSFKYENHKKVKLSKNV